MTLDEFLKLEPEYISNDFSELYGSRYTFIPEINLQSFVTTISERIKIHVLKYFQFDHRRYWRLAVVYFDNDPIMITQNAGREGNDHAQSYIINSKNYVLMVSYLFTLTRTADVRVDLAEFDVSKLLFFYDHDYNDNFKKFE